MKDATPDISLLLEGPLRRLEPLEQEIFCSRLSLFWDDIERPLRLLYGERPDYETWRDHFLSLVARSYAQRPSELRMLDLQRLAEEDWVQQPRMIGYVCYTERFAGDLRGVEDRIDYLEELGVNYLHLMPLLKPRTGANDGGYAVLDYRQVRDDLGTMDDLAHLAGSLRARGVSLCIDLVCNHTAK